MIRSVDFIPRTKAELLSARDDLAIISITEPEVERAKLTIPENRILRLAFHDVDPGNDTESRWMLFDEEHAGQVVEFVRRLQSDSHPVDLIIHCRAGISRSAAVALFAEEETGCDFPRKPFSGLANQHLLTTLGRLTGRQLARPRALPKREQFSVGVQRNFNTGQASVTVANMRNGQSIVMEGPMLEVPELAAAGIQRVWGIVDPPPSYHVADWNSLDALPSATDITAKA